MKRPLFNLAAGLALVSVMPAQAAEPAQCITPREMEGLISYFLPNVIDEVSANCSPHLAPDSYLRAKLPQLAGKLTLTRDTTWPIAKAAFLKMASPADAKAMTGLPDEALRPMVDQVIGKRISIPVTAQVCGDVNDISDALAPLSAGQTVHLLAAIFTAAARKDNKLQSCPRESR
jgi:hypothetical protein